MDALRQKLLSRSRLPVDHDGGIALCDLFSLLYDPFHRRALANDILKLVFRREHMFFLRFPGRGHAGQLLLQLENLPVQIVDLIPVLHHVEAAQNLAVLDDRVGVGVGGDLLAVAGDVVLPVI